MLFLSKITFLFLNSKGIIVCMICKLFGLVKEITKGAKTGCLIPEIADFVNFIIRVSSFGDYKNAFLENLVFGRLNVSSHVHYIPEFTVMAIKGFYLPAAVSFSQFP